MTKLSARQACWATLALAVSLLSASGAGAVDWYTGDKTSEPDFAPTIVLDASGSFTSKQSTFGAVAATAAVSGNLGETGFRARGEAIVGDYDYDATSNGVTRKIQADQQSGGALVGYAWVQPKWTYAVFGGVQAVNTNLSPLDVNNTTSGLHIGAKIVGEFYGNPTDRTMVSGYGSYGTANNDYYSRFKAGYAIWERVFIGPEFLALGDKFYTEYRAGLHITGVKLGGLGLGVSGGVISNRITGSGAYAILDARLGF